MRHRQPIGVAILTREKASLCIPLPVVHDLIALRGWTLTLGKVHLVRITSSLHFLAHEPAIVLLVHQGLLKLHLLLHFLLLICQNGMLAILWLHLVYRHYATAINNGTALGYLLDRGPREGVGICP